MLSSKNIDKNSLLDELNIRKTELNVKKNIPSMITDEREDNGGVIQLAR